jgi:DNA-binding MarR family transcriptional regulator
MDRTTLTRNLNILKKSGWVKSNTGSDERFTYINLTAKGNKVLSKVFPHWSKAQEQVKKILGGELDSLRFRKTLKNINTNPI